MLKTLSLVGAAFALGATVLIPVTPAAAQRYHRDDRGYHGRDSYRPRQDDRRSDRRYQKCDDGDGGTIIGAIAGGLLGHEVAGRGDRTLGTVLGAGGGALAGRAIDRSDRPGYCR